MQDPSDPSKWFYSLEDEQFLEDWDLFEQEGGNYAHMIEPAAKRGADKQPWGGDEPNTSAMDPYPATPSDRKLEACMDNLTHQIAQLNQSLSISHVDLGATALIKTQSASYRNKTQTDAGTLAGAGNDMSTVTHTVGVDDAKEIDIDGGDGRDEEAEQALEEEEKPSEVNQLNESMREMVVVMRDLLAAEQRRFEEQEQRRKDELAAATAVPVPDTPELELQKAREEFARMQSEEFRESMANATDTPQSPAAGAVESPPGTTPRPEGFETPSMSQVLQDVAHAYDKELAELKAELEREVAAAEKAPLKRDVPVARKALIGGINAQYQALLDDVIHRRAQAIEAARQSLAAQAPVIAGLHSPNTARQLDFSSLSDLHSPSTMAAIETAAAPEQLLEASAAVADANPQAAVALADAAVAVEKAKLAAVKEAAAAQKRVHFENQ